MWLIPWADAGLRTLATRPGRAVVGLSQGGFCSLGYAARHPDLLETALAYSGIPDIAYDAGDIAGTTAVINATEAGLDGEPPQLDVRQPHERRAHWADHDPSFYDPYGEGTHLWPYWLDSTGARNTST